MALRTTESGLKIIKDFEGLRLKAYPCPAGVWTVGYGHTSAAGGMVVTPKTVINRVTAEKLLREDIDRFEGHVERALGAHLAKLNAHQFDALVSLAFNIGPDAFANSTLVKKIKAGRLDDVPAQFMRWNKVDRQTVEGLTRRRRAEAALWRSLVDEAADAARKLEPVELPQRVDEPKPPKSMAESGIGNGTIVGTGAGSVIAAKEIADRATEAIDAGKGLWDAALALGPWVLLSLAVIVAGAYVWTERRRKLVEEHV